MIQEAENYAYHPFKWRPAYRIGSHMVIMIRKYHHITQFAPLYIHNVSCPSSPTLTEFQEMLLSYPDYSMINHTADRLRWHRLKKGLYQKQVAKSIGLDRTTYANYEDTSRTYYPLDKLQKLAELFEVSVTELMDDYNLFLYKGQGIQIKNLRKNMQLTQPQLAKLMNSSRNTVFRWEHNQIQLSKKSWEVLMNLTINYPNTST